jgi:hypothetical protein
MTAKSSLYDVIRRVLDSENHPFAHDTTKRLVDAIDSAGLLSYLDLDEGICTCGNHFDGDNLCVPSACEREV